MPESASPRAIVFDVVLALAVGGCAYAVSCLLVAPASMAAGFGIQWQMMSERPFDLVGQFPHRWLSPLLAWSFSMGGADYVAFTRGYSVLLLAVVFWFCRRRGAPVVDAAAITGAIAVISPIQMYKEAWVGYPDPLCYALFLLTMLAARRPVLFWTLFFVNLHNHELAVFLLPWLWFVRREADERWRLDAVLAAAAVTAYGAFYLVVRAKAQALFTVDYFVSHPLFPGGSVVVWNLALVHLVVAFGPVLAVLAWHVHTRAHGRERWHFALVALAVFVIFCIAYDWARHTHLLLIPLVLAMLRFLAAGHRLAFLALVVVGVVGMVLVPPWAAKSWPTHAVLDPAMESGVVIVKFTEGDLNVTFGPLQAALQGWLPKALPTLLPILAILAAIWLAGWWLARRRSGGTTSP